MPISGYYRGRGKDVMADMQKRYGPEKGQRVFYATANKKGLTAAGPTNAKKNVLVGRKKHGI